MKRKYISKAPVSSHSTRLVWFDLNSIKDSSLNLRVAKDSVYCKTMLFVCQERLVYEKYLNFYNNFFSVMKLEDLKDVYVNWLALLWEPLRQCYTWVEETVFLLLCCSLSYWQVWTNSVSVQRRKGKSIHCLKKFTRSRTIVFIKILRRGIFTLSAV